MKNFTSLRARYIYEKGSEFEFIADKMKINKNYLIYKEKARYLKEEAFKIDKIYRSKVMIR